MGFGFTYKYPKFILNIETKIQPDIEYIQSALINWAFHFKLCENEIDKKRYMDADFVRLACLTYPRGNCERTIPEAKFMVHVFALDDAILHRKQGPFFSSLMNHNNSFEGMAALLDNAAEDKDTPVAMAFNDYWQEMKRLTNQSWQNRYAGNYIWYLKSNIWEQNNIKARRVPPLAEYLEYRHYTSGFDPSLNLIELSRNIFIPDSIMANPTIHRLSYIAGNVVAFVNDVQSFEKERKDGEVNNLVTVLKHEFEITYQEAIERAVQMTNEQMKQFLALESLIPKFGTKLDNDVNMFIEGLRDWMAGNLEWGSSSGRYIRLSYPKELF